MYTINKTKKIVGIVIGITLVISSIVYYNRVNTKKYNNILTAANEYMNKENYDQAIRLYNQALDYKKNIIDISQKKQLAENLKKDKELYNCAIKEFKNKNYIKTIEILEKISKGDTKFYSLAQSKINECNKICIQDNLEKANNQIDNGKFNEANKYLDNVLKIDSKNQEVKKLKNTITKKKKDISDKQNDLLKGEVTFVTQYTLDAIERTRLAEQRNESDEDLSEYFVSLKNIKDNEADFSYLHSSKHGTCTGNEGIACYKGNGVWYFDANNSSRGFHEIGYLTIYNNGENAKITFTSINEDDGEGVNEGLKKLEKDKDCMHESLIRCDNYYKICNRY